MITPPDRDRASAPRFRFRIEFTDAGEPCSQIWRGFDHDHAEERFWDSIHACGGPEGIHVLSITRLPKRVKRHPKLSS